MQYDFGYLLPNQIPTADANQGRPAHQQGLRVLLMTVQIFDAEVQTLAAPANAFDHEWVKGA